MKTGSLTVLLAILVASCVPPDARSHKRVFYSLCLANRTTSVVFGSYQFSNFTNTVGVISPWCGATEGFMPTDPNGKITVTFRNETGIVAKATFEPMKSFPTNLKTSITTTYTLLPGNDIQLSFGFNAGDMKTSRIIPGEKESDTVFRELGENLVMSAGWGTPEEVHRLLADGADINARNDFGMSAIMMAASNKRIDLVRFLKDKGADLSFKNGNDKSVYDIAKDDEELLKILGPQQDKGGYSE